jgi:hypothetical protein
MKRIAPTLRTAALIGALVILPFLILQLVNMTITRPKQVGDLLVLFGLLWLLATAFVFTLTTRRGYVVVRVALLILIGLAWGGLVVDQMPCFLGIPNCD